MANQWGSGGTAGKRIVEKKSIEGREFNSGRSYEQISAEGARRRTATSGAAYGAVAAGAGAAATGIGNLKIAGTKAGQHSLGQVQRHLRHSGNPLAHQVGQIKSLGAKTAAHRGKASLALGAATAISGAAAVGERFRNNEEAGISQGIGRMKAGSAYRRDQTKIVKFSPLRSAAMMSDANFTDPRVMRAAALLKTHQTKVVAGTAATAATAATAKGAYGVSRRKAARDALRTEVGKRADDFTVKDRQYSGRRALGAAAGGTALAWGVPRTRTANGMIAYAASPGRPGLNAAAADAARIQARMVSLTKPVGRTARAWSGYSTVGRAALKLPRSTRIGLGTLAGYELTRRNTPISRVRYRQIVGVTQRGV